MIRTLLFLIASYCTWYWLGRKVQFQRGAEGPELAQVLAMLDREKLGELWNAAGGGEIAMLAIGVVMVLVAVVVLYGLPVVMFRAGMAGNGFWSFVGGSLGAAMFTLFWALTISQALTPVWILAVLAALFWAGVLAAAAAPSFRARKAAASVEVEGAVVSVTSGTSARVFPVGLIALQRAPEIYTYEATAGGPYMSYQQVSVTNADGSTGYGSVSVPVNAPYYQVTRRRKTGATEYTFVELGPDHGLQVARKPRGVRVLCRNAGDARISICLRGLDRLRFDYWCKFHPKLFFAANGNDAHRIKDAAAMVMGEVKRKHGKPAQHELALDHNLQIAGLIALYKEKVLVISDTAVPMIEQVLDTPALVHSYHHRDKCLEVGGRRFWVGDELRVQIERRVQVAMAHGVA